MADAAAGSAPVNSVLSPARLEYCGATSAPSAKGIASRAPEAKLVLFVQTHRRLLRDSSPCSMQLRRRPIPILMYHAVAPRLIPGFEKYTVTTAAFSTQLRWLAAAGYTTVHLDELLAEHDGAALPPRPVILTFDDGFQTCVEHAVPLLDAHGFTATFFFVAGLVGGRSEWLLRDRGITLSHMGWPEARQLVAEGFVCGSHSPAVHVEAAEAGYVSACSVRQGLSGPSDELFALHRVPITGHDSLPDFVWRLRTAWAVGEFVGARRTAHGGDYNVSEPIDTRGAVPAQCPDPHLPAVRRAPPRDGRAG